MFNKKQLVKCNHDFPIDIYVSGKKEGRRCSNCGRDPRIKGEI